MHGVCTPPDRVRRSIKGPNGPGDENNGAYKIEMLQRRTARWTLKRYHNTSTVSNMLHDLGWRSLEQRRADSRLTVMYKIYNGHVPINASKYLWPMARRSLHLHSNSFIPLSTSTSSHRLSFFPKNYYAMEQSTPVYFR